MYMPPFETSRVVKKHSSKYKNLALMLKLNNIHLQSIMHLFFSSLTLVWDGHVQIDTCRNAGVVSHPGLETGVPLKRIQSGAGNNLPLRQ